MRKKFDTDLKEEKNESMNVIQDLRARLESAEITLVQISSYRVEKEAHDAKLKELEKINEDQKKQMFDALENQERKFLEDKAALIKEQEMQMLKFREVALKEAKDLMGMEAQKLMVNNNHMYEELKFLHAFTAELQQEKTRLENSLSVTTRDISILADKELEYARQSLFKTKEIKGLRERVEHLEKIQVVNIERFKHRTHDIKTSVSKELEEALLDAAALRRLLQIKNKELRKMKGLAVTILSQRSEVEQFFLEALQEVKQVVQSEKKKSHQENKTQLSKLRGAAANSGAVASNAIRGTMNASAAMNASKTFRGNGLPAIKLKNSTQVEHMQDQNVADDTQLLRNLKVDIKDLSWKDKELVLRVLFAKMNGLNSMNLDAYQPKQDHSKNTGDLNATFLSNGAGISEMQQDGDEEGNNTINADMLAEQYKIALPDDGGEPPHMQ